MSSSRALMPRRLTGVEMQRIRDSAKAKKDQTRKAKKEDQKGEEGSV